MYIAGLLFQLREPATTVQDGLSITSPTRGSFYIAGWRLAE